MSVWWWMGIAWGSPTTPASASVAPALACPSSTIALMGEQPSDARLQGSNTVVVIKSARRIMRYTHGRLVHTKDGPACWKIGLGPTPIGHKQREGDGKTPEGWYRSSDKPWSQWYAAIAIHYPNADDATAASKDGRIDRNTADGLIRSLNNDKKPLQTSPLGGEILIHGGGSARDWTEGCIAMNNDDIDALRATLPDSQVTDVLILP